ncbi:alpha/beta hydrolase domain-containing protein [Sphingomonas sp. LH128]|uniref:alpha/beta hydrolase n=1 Tax=Sphingomonas sp. LH128 TaxID=473781 RepID=UPI00027CC270|nr:alpha/beta hydrolase [Sphingomonas sp. LH128]EJU13079.1 alpha/beta hydrolase domain-containing protein [Sphingomonas sp. LH128]
MDTTTRAMPAFLPDGSVEVPAFTLPVSDLVSAQAAAMQRLRAEMPAFDAAGEDGDIAARRAQINAYMAPQIERLRAAFPVSIVRSVIGGVEVLDVTPAEGGHDPHRVLINLHGGAFCVGWDGVALVEAIPIASLGRIRVISVNYRMAPEYRHPAGVEDVAAVYGALLEDYAPGRIGIYGGSAGGALTAQAAAWLVAHDLPQVGAIGVFGAGGVPFGTGESAYVTGYTDASFPPPPADGSAPADITHGYFAGCDARDPSAWPGWHPAILAHFPPALIITGTRAMDLSPAIFTHSQLLKAGVRSSLIVGEGMGHCYHYQLDLPEGRDAVEAIVRFFRENLT